MHAECRPVVENLPECGGLGDSVRTLRPERRRLVRPFRTQIAEALARARVVKPDRPADETNRFQQVVGSDCDAFERLHRLLERQRYGSLPGEVIDLVRLGPGEGVKGAAKICEGQGLELDAITDPQS